MTATKAAERVAKRIDAVTSKEAWAAANIKILMVEKSIALRGRERMYEGCASSRAFASKKSGWTKAEAAWRVAEAAWRVAAGTALRCAPVGARAAADEATSAAWVTEREAASVSVDG